MSGMTSGFSVTVCGFTCIEGPVLNGSIRVGNLYSGLFSETSKRKQGTHVGSLTWPKRIREWWWKICCAGDGAAQPRYK